MLHSEDNCCKTEISHQYKLRINQFQEVILFGHLKITRSLPTSCVATCYKESYEFRLETREAQGSLIMKNIVCKNHSYVLQCMRSVTIPLLLDSSPKGSVAAVHRQLPGHDNVVLCFAYNFVERSAKIIASNCSFQAASFSNIF